MKVEVNKLRKQLQPRCLVWSRLEDTDCKSPDDCLMRRHDEIDKQIQAANPSDVERSGALKHWASITLPPERSMISNLFNWRFDIAVYEKPLIQLATSRRGSGRSGPVA